jgi:hypothetical protein
MLADIQFRIFCFTVSSLKIFKIKIHKTVIVLVLYWYETGLSLSLSLREEHRLRVFENRVLRRMFRRKWEELVGKRRRLHDEELHNLPCMLHQVLLE